MPQQIDLYQLLVSCPSDIVDELSIIEKVIANWNESTGYKIGCAIRYVHWKNSSIPVYGDRPQELLNDQIVSPADIIVAIFWSRFGSNTGIAESGTVEEIELCIAEDKDIMLYFSELPIPRNLIVPSNLEKIDAFKDKYRDKGIYWTYKSLIEFEEFFSRHLDDLMNTIHNRTPTAIYKEIVANMESLIECSRECGRFIRNEITSLQLSNFIELKTAYVNNLASKFFASFVCIPRNDEDKLFHVPMKNRDFIGYCYRDLSMMRSDILTLVKSEYSVEILLQRAKRIQLDLELGFIEILANLLLTSPRRSELRVISSCYKGRGRFSYIKMEHLSFRPGKTGWRRNMEYYQEVFKVKQREGFEQALSFKNKVTEKGLM